LENFYTLRLRKTTTILNEESRLIIEEVAGAQKKKCVLIVAIPPHLHFFPFLILCQKGIK
jgi:hypothetical protein